MSKTRAFGIGKKRATCNDRLSAFLRQLSKEALIDVCGDMLIGDFGITESVDNEDEFMRFVARKTEPALRVRGDKMPKPHCGASEADIQSALDFGKTAEQHLRG